MKDLNLKISIITENNDSSTKFFNGKLNDLITETVAKNLHPEWEVIITEIAYHPEGNQHSDHEIIATVATKKNGEWTLYR